MHSATRACSLPARFYIIFMKFRYLYLILLLLSCNGNPKNPEQANKYLKKDTSAAPNSVADSDSLDAILERTLESNNIFLSKLLDSCINIAYKQGFNESFTLKIDTNAYRKKMHATITFGNLFANDRKHLLITRGTNFDFDIITDLYSDIYLLDQNKFKKVAADTCVESGWNTRFEDINRDGYKDYIVQSYAISGCCPRNLEMGYIYNAQNGHFNTVDFWNRQNDSLTSNFFESSYGRDYHISLYKYKWKGIRKVLLEEVYVTRRKNGEAIYPPTSYTRVFYPSEKKQQLKKLPPEYARLGMAELISYPGN